MGKLIFFKFKQPEKASCPISVIVSGRVIFSIPSFPVKDLSPIFNTFLLSISDGILILVEYEPT
ncbi:hypothetical protein ACTNDG_09100 [Clostridium sp. HCP1S3_B4]|uniref:hypothetical protein n=1 Tax=Clostridium sp. HCP1S3_B4 TaxID=3438918 RepID=UPI003F8B0A63